MSKIYDIISWKTYVTRILKDIWTSMYIWALFTISRTWKQPRCSPTDEWREKMWCIYTVEYYSAMKKKEIMPFAATWMDLEIITLSEVRKRNTNTIWYHLYVESKKDTNELIYKTDSQIWKTNFWLPKGKVGGAGIN